MKSRLTFFLIFCAISFLSPDVTGQSFQDVAPSFNIINGYGPVGYFGGGVSFCDFNDDGWDDLTFARGDGLNIQFFENQNGVFTEITAPISYLEQSKQVLWVDFDNDGDKDFFVTGWFEQNRLFENDGSFTFTDITASAGIPIQNDPTFGANFGDTNNDGFLDVYVSNYGWSPTSYTNYFLMNNGDGTFTNQTSASGLYLPPSLTFCSVFLDINHNMTQDIYLANDKIYANSLFRNMGGSLYANIGSISGANIVMDAMNVGPGDYDNDGDLDIYMTNNWTESYLLVNDGSENFSVAPTSTGVGFFRMGWAGNFFDFDNDTDLDLYVCGMVPGVNIPNALFVNQGDGTFTEPLFASGGLAGKDTVISYSNTIGDYNNDGRLDIAVGNSEGYNFALWQNQEVNTNNYLKIKLEGILSNKDGIGSWIEIYINGNKYVRYSFLGEAFLAQKSMVQHFGLGTAASVDSVKIKWLSGVVDVYYNVAANQKITVVEGNTSVALPIELSTFTATPTSEQNILLKWSTESEVDFHGFELLRRRDGSAFEQIAWVDGKGQANTPAGYSFTDRHVLPNVNYYYQLKNKNTDGTFMLSKVVTARVQSADPDQITLFPNPVRADDKTVYLRSSRHASVDVRIFSMDGRLITAVDDFALSGTDTPFQLPEELGPGIFLVSIAEGSKIIHEEKLVIVK